MKYILEDYLNSLNESGWMDDPRVLQTFVYVLFIIIMTVLGIIELFTSTKQNKSLSDKLFEVTGKRYPVKVLEEKSPNAFCFGGIGSTVFVTSGLLQMCNQREQIAVCLHEVGHITNLDEIKSLLTSGGSLGIAGYICIKMISFTEKNTSIKKSALLRFVTLWCIGILFLVMWKTPGIILAKLHEYRADKYAVQFGYGNDLANALQKLQDWVENEWKKQSPGAVSKFFRKLDELLDDHPEMKKRIERLFENASLYKAMIEKDKKKIKQVIDLAMNVPTKK